MDSSLPGSSIHGIFQARVLSEWVAIAFSLKFTSSLILLIDFVWFFLLLIEVHFQAQLIFNIKTMSNYVVLVI